jgi:hypothetical protein
MRGMQSAAVRRSRPLLFALMMLTFATGAHAEQLFVADKLVLNMYAQPDQHSDKLATLETGDAVESLERVENFVHVRLQDGREGWVGASYLTPQAPAIVRLRELQREQKSAAPGAQKQSTEEIARLQKQNATLQSELEAVKRKAASTPQKMPETAAPEPASSPPPEETVRQSRPATDTSLPTRTGWLWALLALVTGVAGYAAGYQTLARRMRRKFGGVKIY